MYMYLISNLGHNFLKTFPTAMWNCRESHICPIKSTRLHMEGVPHFPMLLLALPSRVTTILFILASATACWVVNQCSYLARLFPTRYNRNIGWLLAASNLDINSTPKWIHIIQSNPRWRTCSL